MGNLSQTFSSSLIDRLEFLMIEVDGLAGGYEKGDF